MAKPTFPSKTDGKPAAKYIKCPAHGYDLKVETMDGKQIAVCRCKVKNNIHFGQPVWESPDTRRTV